MKTLALTILVAFGLSFAQNQRIGAFLVGQQRDPITDEKQAILITEFNAGFVDSGRLYYGCVGVKPIVMVNTEHFFFDDSVRGVVRFGTGAPKNLNFIRSGSSVILPPNENAWFVRNSKVNQKVVVRLFSTSDAYTYTFSLQGFSRAATMTPCFDAVLRAEAEARNRPTIPTNRPVPNIGYVFAADLIKGFGATIEPLSSSFFINLNGQESYLSKSSAAPRFAALIYKDFLMAPISMLTIDFGCRVISLDSKTFRATIRCGQRTAILDYRVWPTTNINSTQDMKRLNVQVLNQQASTPQEEPVTAQPLEVTPQQQEETALEACKRVVGDYQEYAEASYTMPENAETWTYAQIPESDGIPIRSFWCKVK